MVEAKIQVNDLNAWYGDFHVLKSLNFEILPNTVTAIMGPSGCGKTSFIRILNRLCDMVPEFHHTGEILIDGQDVFGADIDVYELRKGIGFVFQKPNPFPMSIYDNVAYGPKTHGMKDINEIVQRSLEQSALWDEVGHRLDEPALKLSGGQQQRLCLARALAVNPGIILMDEPVAFLDPISAQKIEELIMTLKRDYTIVLVTHNVQQALRVSDSAAFLYLGELIEYGRTSLIAETPKDPRTEAFLTGRFG
ncbi:MAG: phosphate ABC transporter ATP-binding protein PstB [Candidatus Hermodarchaeota archaeon]|nr:phosphate ABC transporter ATP-binding protein PstB [Candidatus Hermodarchaeota archaeon]